MFDIFYLFFFIKKKDNCCFVVVCGVGDCFKKKGFTKSIFFFFFFFFFGLLVLKTHVLTFNLILSEWSFWCSGALAGWCGEYVECRDAFLRSLELMSSSVLAQAQRF
eukprot:TRINITY_DN9418_c0_g1_i1.p2 TRINITY_DN9418_c0_g1~~TRINITY_DN9418_c0_g1_i1.p2  ORF type:complete len:107 (-),score=17.73 TRINITY_DN9418_c0_g1_i1:212-532(-)